MGRADLTALWTVQEAAEFLGVCDRTVRDHVKDGRLPYIAVGRGVVRTKMMFDQADLRRFQAEHNPLMADEETRRRSQGEWFYLGPDLDAEMDRSRTAGVVP
jgi:excisionase family DNA binding protein